MRPLNMRIGLVISTPEQTEKYLIDVEKYNLEASMAIRPDHESLARYWLSDSPESPPVKYEKRIKATFSGILLAYPPLPRLPLED